jgi:ABC-type branched-subunit amino acid transport system substrate-binding protein
MKSVVEVPFEAKDSDLKPHIMKLRQAKPDMVLLWITPGQAAKVVGISKAMKFDTQFMSVSTCSDFIFMNAITKGAWEGVITGTFGEIPDSKLPMMAKYKKEVFEKYAAKGERWGIFYYAGILFTEPMIEGLKNAGRDLTREKFITAMENIKGFKGIGPEVNYTPYKKGDIYSRQGTAETFLVQCLKGGGTKQLTGLMSTK